MTIKSKMTFEKKLVLTIGIVALILFVIDAQFHRTLLNAIGCGLLGSIVFICIFSWEK